MGEMCAACGNSDAVIKIQTMMGPVTEEIWLCRSCADKRGIDIHEPAIEPRTADLLAGLLRPRPPKRRKKAAAGESGSQAGQTEPGQRSAAASGKRESSYSGDDVPANGRECPSCGLTLGQLKKTGRVGCVHCYTVFRPIIETVLKDQSFAGRHIGRLPDRLATYRYIFVDRERLARSLAAAIEREDFEEAAQLREEIGRMDRLEGLSDDHG